MTIYAVATDGSSAGPYVQTVLQQPNFEILDVPAGTYRMYAVLTSQLARLRQSGWANMSPEQHCDSAGSAAAVDVRGGSTVSGVVLQMGPCSDQAGNWPLPPSTAPVSPTAPQDKAYADAFDAASAGALFFDAKIERGACSPNEACTLLDATEHAGTSSAYFTGKSGSNSILMNCVFAAYEAVDGWHTGDVWCFYRPALDATLGVHEGTQATCWNLRSSPKASASITGCIPFGSKATIDGTPSYEPPANSDFEPMWWHVVDRGWINGVAICRADPCVGD